MSRRFMAIALGWLLYFQIPASAGEVFLNPSKDNAIFQSTGDQNSHGAGDIFIGRTAQGSNSIRRGLFHFDVAAAIPSGATITGVTLTLRETQGNNGNRAATLHRLLSDWGQGASLASGMGAGNGAPAQDGDATWLYTFYDFDNPSGSPAWSTAGGDFVADGSATTIVSDDLGPGQFFSWSSAVMVADVQGWLDGGDNFGWILRGDESVSQTAKRFSSVEAATASFRPVLHVAYVPEPSSACLFMAAAPWMLGRGRRQCR